ncbi:hypothetical protein DFH28DRAFT_1113366 [Melampsora americana]|nr:hypothetical protein DFH28DRAFT_1113366 [Melampsora americana]
MSNNTTSTTSGKYPNPIPPPPLDQTFPNHEAAELFLHGFASEHGFQIGRLSTRNPTSVIFKCSEGAHRHMTQAKKRAIEGRLTLADPPLKTCPFKITSRRLKKDHSIFYLVIHPESSTHDHGPQEDLPKKIRFIALTSTSASATSTELPPRLVPHPLSQSPPSQSAIPELPAGLLNHQYKQLIQEMQSLPMNTQAYLLNSFLRDCRFAQGITSSAITPSQLQSPYPGPIPPQANVYEQGEEHLTSFTPTLTRSSHDTRTDLAATTSHLESIETGLIESGSKEPPIDPTLDQATLAMLTSGDSKSCKCKNFSFKVYLNHMYSPNLLINFHRFIIFT